MSYGAGENYGTVCIAEPVVITGNGAVLGENRDGIAIFRGIPYGDHCDGKQRFQAPNPAKAWEGILDCRRNGYYAPQIGTSISGDSTLGEYFSGGKQEKFGCKEEEQNENCLVLNVVTPGCDTAKRPVVVYIHGGGFETGSGTLVIGADLWAREEDLVVVGVNHRLNLFGYLYLGELSDCYRDSGMAGMLDLVLALKWVKQNIEKFGGNPDNVTIMGESGGGVKVSVLMAMEEARGLFQRAIVESGSLQKGFRTKAEGTLQARKILKELQISENNLQELEEKTTAEFLDAMKHTNLTSAMEYLPIADEIHLKASSENIFSMAPEKVPLLVGSSEDELAVFTPLDYMDSVTWDNISEKIKERELLRTRDIYSLKDEDTEGLLREYRSINQQCKEPGHLYVKLCSKLSFLASGAYYHAMEKAKQEAEVFYYTISYDTGMPLDQEKKYSWHTADLPLQMRIVLYPECEELSRYFAHSWAAFIRTGNPSTEQIIWEPFTMEEQRTMVIASAIPHMESDPWRAERKLLEHFDQIAQE